MRLLIILAVLALASFAAIFAGRYFGRNMDEHGRTALALLLAPLPQFLFSLHQVLFTPPFGYGRMFNAAGYFWLSYGVILLVGLPMHMLLRKGGYRRLGQYIAVSIFAALVVGFVLTQVSAQISVHPDFEGRSFSERSSMAGGIFALGVIFAVPAAITRQ